jgi:hypothetical protein
MTAMHANTSHSNNANNISPSGFSHSFDTGIAFHLKNLEAAALFNHIVFWLRTNKANGVNQIEGKTWMFQTMESMSKVMGYLTEKQIKDAMKKLVDAGLLIKGNFNENPFDRTNWYCLADESFLSDVQPPLNTKKPIPNPGKSKNLYECTDPYNQIVQNRTMYNDKDIEEDIEIKSPSNEGPKGSANAPPSPQEQRLCEELFKSIQQNDHNAKKPKFDEWAKKFRTLLKSRNEHEILRVLRWFPSDHYYASIIDSAAKFCHKRNFESMLRKMNAQSKNGNGNGYHKKPVHVLPERSKELPVFTNPWKDENLKKGEKNE